jgi:hypothetical protein
MIAGRKSRLTTSRVQNKLFGPVECGCFFQTTSLQVMGTTKTGAVVIKSDLLSDQAVTVYMAYQPGSLCIHAMTVGLSTFHVTR